MPRKSLLGSLLIFTLLILVLLPSGGVALADPPPPMERQMVALEPATGAADPGAMSDISAMATTVFYPSHDAPVREGAPSATAPNQLYLGAGYDNGWLYGSTGRVRSYLRFNLSSLPADSTITSATLRVYQVAGQDYPGVTRTITFYRATGSWNESSITWNNRPGYAEAVGSVHTTYNFAGWRDVDLTDLVRAWVAGSQTNYGLVAIGPESIEGVLRAFGSRESAYGPELHISYVPTPPPVLDVSPGSQYVRADSSKQLSVQISNVTANSLSWTATKLGGAAWLSLDKTAGSATPASPDTLGLTVNPGGRPLGIYTEQIRISSTTPEVEGSPQTVAVTMEVVDSLEQVYVPFILKGGGGSTAPEVVALIVGIGDYKELPSASASGDLPDGWGDEATDLPNPPRDVEDFHIALLEELDVSQDSILRYGGGPDETTGTGLLEVDGDVILQSYPIATRNNIISAFGQLDNMEDEGTIVIFYYSGHGGQNPDLDDDEGDDFDEFIAMYDTDVVDNQFINILTDDDLNALLASLESQHILIILDSCYSGSMVDAAAMGRSGDLRRRGLGKPRYNGVDSVPGELMAMADLSGPARVIITGGTGDQSTWESDSLQNGVFTYFYLQGLKDAVNDANQNSRVSAEEAYWFSRDLVDDWVYSNVGEHQNPDIYDRYSGQIDLTWLP
jgi:hypothetical protein